MSLQKGTIPVLAAPAIDPGQIRIAVELPLGLTIAAIIDQVLPDKGLPRDRIRIALVSSRGSVIVLQGQWERIKPKPGVRVVIRVVPGKGFLSSILQIVVSIAAIALGAFFAPALAGALGISQGLAQGLIGMGVTVLGNLLINALIPPPKADNDQKNVYSISGWRNRIDPDGAVPVPLGSIRFAPPFAALPHTQIIGDDQYVCAVFNFGYGRLLLDDFRIGETSLSEYNNVEIEVREGVVGDAPFSLLPRQVAEETVGAELTRPKPRDDKGEIISGPTIETPVVRTTGADASGGSIILAWPAGLFSSNDEGKLRQASVSVRIEQRLITADEWQLVTTLDVTARKREAFFRQHTWDFPSRGRWQVRLTMMTDENTSLQISNRTSWAALQTLRPEYPFNFGKPFAGVALRVKATHQLNGQLDNFNARARRVCPDWDHVSDVWTARDTRNPAALYRYALQGSPNARPVSNAGIDLDQLADWHDFCRIKGLKYDRVIDDPSMSLRDVLAEIAAAGRASPRHDGRKWGVVIDRPQELIVDHFSPRNAYGFKVSRSYLRHPHGIRVQFLDETNDNKMAERIMRWPGYVGDMTEIERFEMPGKTDPSEVYRETMRRMFEAKCRPDTYRLSQDGPIGVATRGDAVVLSLDVIEHTQVAGRVKAVVGSIVELDERVTMKASESYAIRFRVFADSEDTIGSSVVRTVATVEGEQLHLTLTGSGPAPVVGSLILFGLAGSESSKLIVTAVEAGQDFSSHFRLIDAAPIIDDLTDALEIPAWSGRVGAEIDDSLLQPAEPRFTSISSGASGTGTANLITFLIEPGAGPVPASTIVIEHRLIGAGSWTPITMPAANGGGEITGYVKGNNVEIRAYAVSASGTAGPATPTISLTVGSDDAQIPSALDDDMISVGALLGGAVIQFATTEDTAGTRVQVYRSTSAILNRATDAAGTPLVVLPSRSYSTPIGDTTRQNLLVNGNMDSGASWDLGAGWSIASGKAMHTPGTADAIGQVRAMAAGKYYRVSAVISNVTAGDLTPKLVGGSDRSGIAQTAAGQFSDRIQAVTGNNKVEFLASSSFDGELDNVVVYLETTTSLAQTTHYIWLEPQNDDGLPGPVSGPFTVNIR